MNADVGAWGGAAGSFDDDAVDHSLSVPAVRTAWADLVDEVLPEPPARGWWLELPRADVKALDRRTTFVGYRGTGPYVVMNTPDGGRSFYCAHTGSGDDRDQAMRLPGALVDHYDPHGGLVVLVPREEMTDVRVEWQPLGPPSPPQSP